MPSSLLFQELTSNLLSKLSEDQVASLVTELTDIEADDEFSSEWLADLFYPLLNPSGAWADYNPAVYYWRNLYYLAYPGKYFPISAMPPFPNQSDYTDLTAPRSSFYV